MTQCKSCLKSLKEHLLQSDRVIDILPAEFAYPFLSNFTEKKPRQIMPEALASTSGAPPSQTDIFQRDDLPFSLDLRRLTIQITAR